MAPLFLYRNQSILYFDRLSRSRLSRVRHSALVKATRPEDDRCIGTCLDDGFPASGFSPVPSNNLPSNARKIKLAAEKSLFFPLFNRIFRRSIRSRLPA